jgi:hypothetical protein
MSLVSQLRSLAKRQEEDPRDAIASLLSAAKEDRVFRRQMLFLLRAPAVHRKALLNTALYEMKLRAEPKSVRVAFAVLATDEGRKAALAALNDE